MKVLKYFKNCTIQKISKYALTTLAFSGMFNPSSLNADSISQQERSYKTKMLECVKDKVLTHEEIKELYETLKTPARENNNSVDFSKLLENYPGLVDNKARVTYSFSKQLSTEETQALKEVIRENPSPKLEELLSKDQLNIQDLAIAYLFYNNEAEVMEPTDLLTKTTIAGIFESHLRAYEKYFNARKNMEESWLNNKKIKFIGFVQFAIREQPIKSYNETRNNILEQTRSYTQMNNIELKSREEDLPDYHFPGPFDFIVLLSTVAPALLRLMLKNYRKESRWTDTEVGYHIVDGGLSLLGIDALHPYILPARLMIPFIWEIGKGVKK